MKLIHDIKSFLEFIYEYLRNNKELSFNYIKKKISPELRDSALLKYTLNYLIEQEGVLIEKKIKGDIIYELVNEKNLKNYIKSLDEERKEEEYIFKKLEENKKYGLKEKKIIKEINFQKERSSFNKKNDILYIFVYSVPNTKRREIKEIIKNYSQYEFIEFSRLVKLLLSKAKNEVLISSPFMDFDGINFIINDIKNLADNKIKLKILTRNISLKNSNMSNTMYYRRLIGFRNIFYILNENLFFLKEFDININPLNQNLLFHYEGFHQKMIIIDNELCYLGSGELTLASLHMNGECGILITGKIVEFWKEFFNLFWNSSESKTIKLEQINLLLNSNH
ncbi:MAG: phospholipase D-like domain-containing protein [Candidatus Helarchaeota archaeon]